MRKTDTKKLFTFLSQVLIISISRERNSLLLNKSLGIYLLNVDLAKYQKNLSVLKYHDEICQISCFDL